jgi:hypothetical protein
MAKGKNEALQEKQSFDNQPKSLMAESPFP